MLSKRQHDYMLLNMVAAQLAPTPDRYPQALRDLEELATALAKRTLHAMKDVTPPAPPRRNDPDWHLPSAA
jgi:hypothetical protein